jgi:hypothetical protein
MAFREVLVTQVKEVLRAWLAGAGKRPAARRADVDVDVKTAMRYIKAAQAAGLVRDGDESGGPRGSGRGAGLRRLCGRGFG